MLGKVLYWVTVVLVSLALVVALILFLESRDDSSLGGARLLGPFKAVHSQTPPLS